MRCPALFSRIFCPAFYPLSLPHPALPLFTHSHLPGASWFASGASWHGVIFRLQGRQSKQTGGYFPSATDAKEDCMDAIFRPCGGKSIYIQH